MPELPDVTVYVEAVAARITGHRLEGVRVASPFLLRSVDPPLATAGRCKTTLTCLSRHGQSLSTISTTPSNVVDIKYGKSAPGSAARTCDGHGSGGVVCAANMHASCSSSAS